MSANKFENFLNSTWEPLLLQTLVVTGDLGLARANLLHAYQEAAQKWGKVSKNDPESYVRQLAWLGDQTQAKPIQIPDHDQAVLNGLAKLSVVARKSMGMAAFSQVPFSDIPGQVGFKSDLEFSTQIDNWLDQFADIAQVPISQTVSLIEGLQPVGNLAPAPNAKTIWRNAHKQWRIKYLLGALAAIGLLLIGGKYMLVKPNPYVETKLSNKVLISEKQLQRITKSNRWKLSKTSDNTAGSGIHNSCQVQRFADPDGVQTLVREFQTKTAVQRKITESIEVSKSPQESVRAYRTVVNWFSKCLNTPIQATNAYRVSGVGDAANIYLYKSSPSGKLGELALLVARVSNKLIWTTVTTDTGKNVNLTKLAKLLTTTVDQLCDCKPVQQLKEIVPPRPPGLGKGLLTGTDLPLLPKVLKSWVGTKPTALKGKPNTAATNCDNTSFAASTGAQTRSFVIPNSKFPIYFGLTQSIGKFASKLKAAEALALISKKMASCEDRDLSAKIPESGKFWWRLDSEVNRDETITYWMGLTQKGRWLSQTTYVSAPSGELDAGQFQKLLTRVKYRLGELR